jgi:hypothetical protein
MIRWSDKRDPFRMLRNRIFDLAVWNSQFVSWILVEIFLFRESTFRKVK